jgi:surface carbohydrate biosynthesis protein (TIGR04326 family)
VTTIVVWDQAEDPPAGAGSGAGTDAGAGAVAVLCWRSYAHGGSVSSVPQYLEAHADRIRSRYLAFVHDLGESVVAGRRVIDHLNFGDGFSFWWMTTIAEKSPLKSPRIYDCLRMLALEEMLADLQPSQLALVSSDRSLAQAMQAMCRNLKTGFKWERRGARQKWSVRSAYLALPYALKAVLSLRYVMMRWPLYKSKDPKWFADRTAIFICSYFIHLDPALCARGQFHSRQWESLPRLLHDSGRRTNWLQLFLVSVAVPDVDTGLSWVRRFNADAVSQGCHAFIDGYITVGLLLRALTTWLKLCAASRRLRHIPSYFRPQGSALWLWPLLRDDWRRSLTGQTGIGNCLAVEQFDAAFDGVPHQEIGLYLCENQAWEKALLRAWRKHGHGRIIGVQHATAPFWHLYYFDDPRSLAATGECALPLPDQLAVNGAVAWTAFVEGGFPESRLVQVEALRYLNLAGLATRPGHNGTRHDEGAFPTGAAPALKVLVLGDLIPASMHHLLAMLVEAMKLLPRQCQVTFKPHPGYAVDLARYRSLAACETAEPLAQILPEYDVAVCANSTSAAVDAYVAGLPVIIGVDGGGLNLSPLRGQAGACFVSSAEDMAAALQGIGSVEAVQDRDRKQFFWLDSRMPRWRQLLTMAAA